jgi:three-Cys-motif partner protein
LGHVLMSNPSSGPGGLRERSKSRLVVLCELESEQAQPVEELVGQRVAAGDKRAIEVQRGDCNVALPRVLAERPIKPKEATFCLLDQRAHECDWETVRTVAAHKADGNKIEVFYFLPVGCSWSICPKPATAARAGAGAKGMRSPRRWRSGWSWRRWRPACVPGGRVGSTRCVWGPFGVW